MIGQNQKMGRYFQGGHLGLAPRIYIKNMMIINCLNSGDTTAMWCSGQSTSDPVLMTIFLCNYFYHLKKLQRKREGE